jgi:hypothetical protein
MTTDEGELRICQCRSNDCTHPRRPMAARGYWEWCQEIATTTLYRVGTSGERGSAMCPHCARDAITSGYYTERL